MATELLREPTVCRLSSARDVPEIRRTLRDGTAAPVVDVGPTGARGLEPLVLVTSGDRTAFFAECTAARAATIAERIDEDSHPDAADAVVEHEPGRSTLPVPAGSPLGLGTRTVLGRCGWVRPTEPDDYRDAGGFQSTNADVRDAATDVLGRGWGDASADEPIGDTWERVADANGDPAIVVNAHGTPADALLLESNPFLPLDGALTLARIVGADDVVVYLAAANERARETVAAAVDELESTAEVRVVTGPDDYRAAEPTMAIEAIEGNHRLEARLRPPGPADAGLHGRPTLVHTPRTLAQVVLAASGADPTRLVTVRGDVYDETTVELARGEPLSTALDAVTVDGTFKAAAVGGRFGGLTPSLDVAADPAALYRAGLGTEGIVEILSAERCVVAHVGERSRFGRDENCGRCVPCREGSTQLTNLLRDAYDGEFRREAILELLRVVRSSSICDFGRDVTRPVATAIDHFEHEFHDHADGKCPTGTCVGDEPPEVTA